MPALEARNKLFAAAVPAYLSASGLFVAVTTKTAADLAERIDHDSLDVRSAAAQIRSWTRT
ncbi:hypothetical protein [Streptomyces sp. NPDC016845]|uniref:hypothetical protein n=1 Tax=Streptomyces sp. NPDC016845 TaxID=3364972 RepID=UPI0037B555F9